MFILLGTLILLLALQRGGYVWYFSNDFQREKSWKRIYDGFVNGQPSVSNREELLLNVTVNLR